MNESFVPADAALVADPDELIEFFSSDTPAAHIYALADCEEPFWSASRWYRRGDAVVGLVALPHLGLLTAYAVSTRDPAGSSELLTQLTPDLPAELLLTGPVGLADAIGRCRKVTWSGPHLRCELVDRRAASQAAEAASAGVVALGPSDLDLLERLYDIEPDAAFFLPYMLDDETFVGVFRDGVLIAAAGTHVISDALGIAAIGAVYAHPERRGEGLGRVVTAAAIGRVADRVATIGLNVSVDNAPARAVYESLGFRQILRYDEAELA